MSESGAALVVADDPWGEIRPDLEFVRQGYPFEAIALAESARVAVTPHLLGLLENLAADLAPVHDGRYGLHLHAICLLAAWRETRAYAPLVKLAAQPEELGEELFGEFDGEILGRSLASVCDGDLAPLKELAGRVDASPWLRGAALDALTTRVMEEDADANEIVDFLVQLGNDEAARLRATSPERCDPTFLGCIINALTDLGPTPALASIRAWYADDLVDETFIDLEDVEEGARKPWRQRLEEFRLSGRGYVTSAAEEMSDWYCFSDPEDDDESEDTDEDYLYDPEDKDLFSYAEPYVRDEPKIGRNDPCPCGSGKKYKKCCLGNEPILG
jgi:hypothetical protein